MAGRHIASRRMRTCSAPASLAAVAWLVASPTLAAEPSAALRRACASGALTPYACNQRGIKTPAAAPVSPTPPAPTPVQTAPTSTPAMATPPAAKPAAVGPTSSAPAAAATPAPAPTAPAPTRAELKRARASAAAATAARPYQDTQKRYRLEIPAGWELRMQGGFASFWKGDSWIELRSVSATSVKLATKSGLDTLQTGYSSLHTLSEGMSTYDTRAGYRMVLDATTVAGRHTSLIVIAAPLSGTDDLVILAGTSAEHADELTEGVKALTSSLHLN